MNTTLEFRSQFTAPQTGVVSRAKTFDVNPAAPSRKDRFMKKAFEIRHTQIIETESDEAEEDPRSPELNKRERFNKKVDSPQKIIDSDEDSNDDYNKMLDESI